MEHSQRIELTVLVSQLAPMPQAAKKLRMSPRTLQRQLKNEGKTYKGLIDQKKKHLAANWVYETDWPINVIAKRLGYSEASPFIRAFWRWYGISPTTMRRQ